MSDIKNAPSNNNDSHAATAAIVNNNKNNTYEGALDALLKSPLHQARTKEALEKTAARRTLTIQDMQTYLKRLSLLGGKNGNDELFPNVVHVTGTKGKGSTSCMCEYIMRQHYGKRTGLFTSPHLVDIRERIRINGQPVAKEVFGQVYWEVRKRLEAHANCSTVEDNDPDLPILPGYFRMLTLMAFYTFAHYSPGLDVIILEVGMGGRYDATNVLDMKGRNVVCGVTLLDLDHTRVLGDTLEKVAWEKGGIFQATKGTRESSDKTSNAVSSDARFFVLDSNKKSVVSVFEKCAKEESNGENIKLVGDCTKILPECVVIGLPGKHQRSNAELAVALCDAVIKSATSYGTSKRKRKITDSLYDALEHASWPGRCQTVSLKGAVLPTNLRLDGSHTPISLGAGYDWFCTVAADTADTAASRILIFNCSHERNPVELLQLLLPAEGAIPFDKAYFCRADSARPSAVTKQNAKDLLQEQGIRVRADLLPDTSTIVTWQITLEAIWKHLEAEADVSNVVKAESVANLTVGEALDLIKAVSSDASAATHVEVFVVGSLYIVGSALSATGWTETEAIGNVNINQIC